MTNGRIPLCPKDNCGFRCCEFNQGNYIVLFPGELERTEQSTEHLQIIDHDYNGGKKAVCTAADTSTCDNGYKPLDCASYPFFPLVGIKGTVDGFLKGHKCPLLPSEIDYHIEFVRSAWNWLMYANPAIAEWLKKVSLIGYDNL